MQKERKLFNEKLKDGFFMEFLCILEADSIYREVDKRWYPLDELKNTYTFHRREMTPIRINPKYYHGNKYTTLETLKANTYAHGLDDVQQAFNNLKLFYAYPDIKLCMTPSKKRAYSPFERDLHKCMQAMEKDNSGQFDKFQQIAKFNIRHMLIYASFHDKAWIDVGKQYFTEFPEEIDAEFIGKVKQNTKKATGKAMELYESFIEKYNISPEGSKPLFCIHEPVVKELLDNLEGEISHKASCESKDFNQMNSYEKGLMGEIIYSELHGANRVGFRGKKTDVVDQDENISIKTSYTGKWNHHLAYLIHEDASIMQALSDKTALRSLDVDWSASIKRYLHGDAQIHSLAFQNIDSQAGISQRWKVNISFIERLIDEKQYIFQHNNILIHHQGELLFKLNFKKRSENHQVLLCCDQMALNHIVELGHASYSSSPLAEILVQAKARLKG